MIDEGLLSAYNGITNDWLRNNRGRGTVRIAAPMTVEGYLTSVLRRILLAYRTGKAFICVDDNYDATPLAAALHEENINLDSVKIVGVKDAPKYFPLQDYMFAAMVGNEAYKAISATVLANCKWSMVVINKAIPTADMIAIEHDFPPVNNVANSKMLQSLRNTEEIDEYRVGIVLSNDDFQRYNELTAHIDESLAIFGDFKTLVQCLVGNKETGASAAAVRDQLARDNGWSEYLEDNEFNADIDRYYNPNAIHAYASQTSDLLKKRKVLCYSNEQKLPEIAKIVKENEGKKIIIVSAYGDFAAKVTKYLNDYFGYEICGDYHDCIEARPLLDKKGNPITYKSGLNAGKPRIIKSGYISTQNLAKYNNNVQELSFDDGVPSNKMTCLSLRAASDDKIECHADVLILTGKGAGTPRETYYRFNKIIFSQPKKVYRLYMYNTREDTDLMRERSLPNVKIHDEGSGNDCVVAYE